jgi:hypothetical protein
MFKIPTPVAMDNQRARLLASPPFALGAILVGPLPIFIPPFFYPPTHVCQFARYDLARMLLGDFPTPSIVGYSLYSAYCSLKLAPI